MSDSESDSTTTTAENRFEPATPNVGEKFDPVALHDDTDDFDLRPESDSCYKCSTCDTNCPVAEVDDDFPGPKFQGPEQWRLKGQSDDEDHEIDDSITECSNCMRCDSACPSGVSLSQMHNTARGEYVDDQMSKRSLKYWRNRILANYRTSARIASTLPRLANAAMNFGPARWVMEKTLGVTSEREFPAFATETFREWWQARGGAAASKERAQARRRERGEPVDADKKVAYFHGCYANYNTPEVGQAMVRVYEHFGYEIVVPKQGCSGTPMFANGMLDDARRHADITVSSMSDLIEEGYDAIASCTSCSMALRQEYPELFDIDGIETVASNTFEAVEYLRIHEPLRETVQSADIDGELADEFAYHAPCHARSQGLDRQAVELFGDLDGVGIDDVGDSCSGISGTYGWKEEKYETSMEIGDDMFDHMESAEGDTGLTECPTCAMQMEHGTGYEVRHPLELLEAALVD
ncbi:anaerobic glycerol-3-phosphate dehydrogenase subunit C [Halobacterium salinarum]|uniref:anaerobic glycerol-3-phosphate dehydrogenase subunit C n=1 Tax=Halobacterium TaxID=2239 RepID=UPI00196652D8|nr:MULTISPECIES: anaerobic glycerol-3-phosphate dehydrogenase subunit C [Halobacterium]MCF2239396.1 anaerobic glycerol-3-phosphate dehydrogenase subunit C [Halobacterium salinarum]MDL0138371.1 anaerobic glycerol-3-phosphate dehydrogenase subunit C [Halobacterium salinarum]QRY22206.1 anaerobic glycerol-3-phosphate dehydrogenase subunit C [Halobacterium sp. GSL-19]WJK63581.1 anaerobic glycerol-3-phosphate dehydrogenase subunit C [Halobacterium salinarum]